jgi:HK97 family phage major capsid protein
MTSKELREKRVTLVTQAQALLDKASAEKRDLTAEENTQFDALHKEADGLKAQIDRLERQERAALELAASQGTIAGGKQDGNKPPGGTPEERQKAYSEAFYRWAIHGPEELTPEERGLLTQRVKEVRAMGVAVDTAGGYLSPDGFIPRIESAMLPFDGVRQTRATIVRTTSGETLWVPTSNDTSNSGELVNENTAVGEQGITVGSKALNAYTFSSKMVKVSLQFLQDTAVSNIEGWLAGRLGERIGRIQGTYHLSGTGSNQPEGLEVVTTLGVTAASSTTVTYDEFVDLEHSVNAAYRRQAEFLISDGLLKETKKLKDGEGRPMWVPGLAVREPDRILGYRYAVDQNIAAPASTVKSLYFGDFSKFWLRDVQSMQMLRLVERYAEYLQVAFLLFVRHDSKLIDAGTNPIKHLVHT